MSQEDLHPSKKTKRINSDDDDKPEAKRIWQRCSPTDDEELNKKLCYPDEGPSRWGGCDEETEVIDLIMLDSETDEDGDCNNEEDDNDFIDDEEEEEEEEDSDEDDSLDANDFLLRWR